MRDMSEIYNREYYKQYDVGVGKVDYEGSVYTEGFLTAVADYIVEGLHPKSVLDAGCAMGYLVAALRDRGVEAYGVDISEYAISKVREDIRPYCAAGSLTEPLPDGLPKRYDLVVTIEVLEHLYEEDGKQAIHNLCALSDRIIFSSTPDDFTERTHVNVQQREYWARLFAAEGFFDDLGYRPTYLTAYASCFKKSGCLLRQIEDYERNIRLADRELSQVTAQLAEAQRVMNEADRQRKAAVEFCTQVYFDTGDGFHEGNSVQLRHAYNTEFDLCVPVEKGTVACRVDPAEESVLVTIKRACAVTDTGICSLQIESNGIAVGNAFIYETADPQMWFPNWREDITELRMTLSVMRITPDAAEDYARQQYMEAENREQSAAALAEQEKQLEHYRSQQELDAQVLAEQREQLGRYQRQQEENAQVLAGQTEQLGQYRQQQELDAQALAEQKEQLGQFRRQQELDAQALAEQKEQLGQYRRHSFRNRIIKESLTLSLLMTFLSLESFHQGYSEIS